MSLLNVTPQWVYWFPVNRAFAGGGGASFKAITSPAMAVGWTAAAAFDTSVATLAGAAVADPGTWIGASVAVASARRVSAGPGAWPVLTSGTAGCNRWVAGLLCDTPALASTGSLVSTTGAAFAGGCIATFPVWAGCEHSR